MKHLITGGAGFIGSNLADSLLKNGEQVVILDDLSRKGSESNLNWLQENHKSVGFVKCDITKDTDKLTEVIKDMDVVYHLAAQVAVTTSVTNPRRDFEINALGTFNVLEAMRIHGKKEATLLYASTNKVYGGMEDVVVLEGDNRYTYRDFPNGISEEQPLDFHSPYGCSKGTGDQYVRDYSRIYDLNTVVFRQSCIYGSRQFGVEDQGWVAWFIIALLTGKKITIYGDGKQVRDILYINDLIEAYSQAVKGIDKVRGQVFNIGGGKDNVISIWRDFKPILENLFDKQIDVVYDDWRPGDQRIYVSDIAKAQRLLGWVPKYNPDKGIKELYNWASANVDLFR